MSWLDTINSKELLKPYNETKVEPRGFIGLFLCLKFIYYEKISDLQFKRMF